MSSPRRSWRRVLAGWVVFASELGAAEMRSLEQLSAIPISAGVLVKQDGQWAASRRRSRCRQRRDRRLRSTPASATAPRRGSTRPTALRSRWSSRCTTWARRSRRRCCCAIRWRARWRPISRCSAMALAALLGLIGLRRRSARWRLSLTLTPADLGARSGRAAMEQGETVEVKVETEDEIGRLAQSFNRMAAGIAERERRITQLAFNDSLTGLPNRAFFRQHLDLELTQAERRGGGARLALRRSRQFQGGQRHARPSGRRRAAARGRRAARRQCRRRAWSPGWAATNSPSSCRSATPARRPARSPAG